MELKNIISSLGYETLVEAEDRPISTCYTSDLLSDVMGNCPEGSLWITIQRHMNVIAVAQLKKISCILFINGVKPDEPVKARAKEEGIYVASTTDSAFEASGKVYHLLHHQ